MPWFKCAETDDLRMSVEERYCNLMNNPYYIIMEYDIPTGKFLYLNKRGQRLFGYTLDKFRDLTIAHFIKDPISSSLATQRLNQLKDGIPLNEEALYAVRDKNGNVLYIKGMEFVLYNGDTPFSIQMVARDVTEKYIMKKRYLDALERETRESSASALDMIKSLRSPML